MMTSGSHPSGTPGGMGDILVIGYGNPLREDDGAGRYAAEQLAQLFDAEAIKIVACHQLTPELAESVSQARLLILIDAQDAHPPGEITQTAVSPAKSSFSVISHHVEPEMLLALTQTLYGIVPHAILVTINGFSFKHADTLSPKMQQALPTLLAHIKTLIRQAR